MIASAAFDLLIVVAEHGQDGASTNILLVNALAIAAKVVIALTR